MAQPTRKPTSTASEWIDQEIPFSGGVLSLQVGIDRNVRPLKSLPDDQNLIAAFCRKMGKEECPRVGDLSQIGVLAAIVR